VKHSRPDIILWLDETPGNGRLDGATSTPMPTPTVAPTKRCFLVDIVCTADECAVNEEEVGLQRLREPGFRKLFDNSGAHKILENPVAHRPKKGQPVILLVFGARGFIPSATYASLHKLLGAQTGAAPAALIKQLLTRIVKVIFKFILLVHHRWRQAV